MGEPAMSRPDHDRPDDRLTVRVHSWLDVAMKQVGVAELKNNLSRILRAVEIGQEVEVMDRARPIARIVPVRDKPKVTILPAKRPWLSVRDLPGHPIAPDIDIVELLLEERADRDPFGS